MKAEVNLHEFLTLALNVDGCPASLFGRRTPREWAPVNHWTGLKMIWTFLAGTEQRSTNSHSVTLQIRQFVSAI
jgi:hypothetical protein